MDVGPEPSPVYSMLTPYLTAYCPNSTPRPVVARVPVNSIVNVSEPVTAATPGPIKMGLSTPPVHTQPFAAHVMPLPTVPSLPWPVRSTHVVAFASCTPAPAFSTPS